MRYVWTIISIFIRIISCYSTGHKLIALGVTRCKSTTKFWYSYWNNLKVITPNLIDSIFCEKNVTEVTEEKLKAEACRAHTFFRYRSSVFVLLLSRSFPSIICITRKKFGKHRKKQEQIWEVNISKTKKFSQQNHLVTSKLTTNGSAATHQSDNQIRKIEMYGPILFQNLIKMCYSID